MRILFVSREYPPDTGGGGIGSYVASVAPGLYEAGHDVHVLSCAPGQTPSDRTIDGVKIHRRGVLRLPGLVRLFGKPAAKRVEAAVACLVHYRRLSTVFDAIEVPDWMAEGLLISAFSSVPTISHLHTPLRLIQTHGDQGWTRSHRVADKLEHHAVRLSTLTTSPSQLLVEALRECGWLDDRDVRLIRYPVDWKMWAAAGEAGDTEPVVTMIGRVERRKAHAVVIEAVSKMRDPGVRVSVIGRAFDQAYVDGLRRLARQGDVALELVGPLNRSDLPGQIAGARVVAMPSRFDSFGMAATEAMAAGRPVVVSDRTGVSEIVAGTTAGAVVRSGTPHDWASALKPYIQDAALAARAGAAGRALVRQQCDPALIAAQRVTAYEEAIGIVRERSFEAHRPTPSPAPLLHRQAPRWFDWASAQSTSEPSNYLYLATAEQLLTLLGQHVVDAGSGLAGLRACALAATPPVSALLLELGAEVAQADISLRELTTARSIAADLGLSPPRSVQSPGFRTPFRPGSFDLVWNSGLLDAFADPVSIVDEMMALTRPGGLVCVQVTGSFNPPTVVARLLHRREGDSHRSSAGAVGYITARSLSAVLASRGLTVLSSSRAEVRRTVPDGQSLPFFRFTTARRLEISVIRVCDRTRLLGSTTGVIARRPLSKAWSSSTSA